jgi:hypothetical protein
MIALWLASASPSAAPATPSREAQAIARGAIPVANQRSIDKLADDLTAQILSSSERNRADPGCDTRLEACQNAAARIAKEAAPNVADQGRKDTSRLLAVAIDVLLTPAERRTAAQFYASSAGRKMALVTIGLSDFRRLPPKVQDVLFAELEGETAVKTAAPSIPALVQRFREETRALPRVQAPGASKARTGE